MSSSNFMILLRIPWARAALDRITTHQAASLHFADWRSFFDAQRSDLRLGKTGVADSQKATLAPLPGE
jgi:hypothetical protein